MDILVLWFIVWALVQVIKSEPARSVVLILGILVAVGALVFNVHIGHPVIVR